jgi:hypothetical protein
MRKDLPEFRVRLTAYMCDNLSYLTVKNEGKRRVVSYFSAGEMPLALANMFENAAEARFALEDAGSISELRAALTKYAKHAKKVDIL